MTIGGTIGRLVKMVRLDKHISRASFFGIACAIFLFPLHFWYSVLAANNAIPTFLGGYSGVMVSVIALVAVTIFPRTLATLLGLSNAKYIIFILVFLTFAFLWLPANILPNWGNNEFIWIGSSFLTNMLYWFAFFVAAFTFTISYADKTHMRLKLVFGILVTSMLLFVSVVTAISGSTLFYGSGFYDYRPGISSYQQLARSVYYGTLFLVPVIKSPYMVAATTLFGLSTLFFIGSRSELAVFAVILVAYYLILVTRGAIKRALPALFAIMVLTGIALVVLDFDSSSVRQFRIFSPSEDASWISRTELTRYAWDEFIKHPLTGNFVSHSSGEAGRPGPYSHNVLSAFVFFGVSGGILFVAILLISLLISIYKSLFSGPLRAHWLLASALSLGMLVFALVSKSVFYSGYALSWGAVAGGFTIDKILRQRESQTLAD